MRWGRINSWQLDKQAKLYSDHCSLNSGDLWQSPLDSQEFSSDLNLFVYSTPLWEKKTKKDERNNEITDDKSDQNIEHYS